LILEAKLFSVPYLANAATIQPDGAVQAWRVDTPIIPETHTGKYIDNIGNNATFNGCLPLEDIGE